MMLRPSPGRPYDVLLQRHTHEMLPDAHAIYEQQKDIRVCVRVRMLVRVRVRECGCASAGVRVRVCECGCASAGVRACVRACVRARVCGMASADV